MKGLTGGDKLSVLYETVKRVALASLGCKVNQYETECIRAQFILPKYLLVPFEEEADIYIINTCTVTQRADHKSRQLIRSSIKRNPKALIVVTGCYAERQPDEVASVEGVDLVLGNKEKVKIRKEVECFLSGGGPYVEVAGVSGIKGYDSISLGEGVPWQTRAFVKIQDGCNQSCAYCVVPFVRGRSRSRTSEDVFREVERLTEKGFKEVVLCGINLGSYGQDSRGGILAKLIRIIEEIKDLKRLRLSSLEPDKIDDELVQAISNSSKVCPHLHIPLQSGDDRILSKMNRRYNSNDYRNLVTRSREAIPGIAITTDVLVGFPGEDEESFSRTYTFIKEIGFSDLHIFKYSRRQETPAARLKETVPEGIKEERGKVLAGLKKRLNLDFRRRFLSQEVELLIEDKKKDGYTVGLTPHYIRVFLTDSQVSVNQIVKARIDRVAPDLTLGSIA